MIVLRTKRHPRMADEEDIRTVRIPKSRLPRKTIGLQNVSIKEVKNFWNSWKTGGSLVLHRIS